MFDYETLRFIAWVIIGLILIGFAITDGFDMGVSALLPILGRSDKERRIMINSVAPHWDGNQVWLITAGGAIFAVWPLVYAVSFSGFYIAMILALAALWLRPVGFDYRSKIDSPAWRATCDNALCLGGLIPSVIFGVAFGNLLQGIPFELNEFLMTSYKGSFFGLLNPFALLCGLVSLSMILTQGATWLLMKTRGYLHHRASNFAQVSALATTLLFVLSGIWAYNLDGYVITSQLATDAAANPLNKEVSTVAHGLFTNFNQNPILWLIPALAAIAPAITAISARNKKDGTAFLMSSLTAASIILTAGIALFPVIIPSSLNPSQSLTIWDATSSEKTLGIVTVVSLIMVPTILGYTLWCYRKMFGRLDEQYIEKNNSSLY
ncbi:cytochrome d ubiquinol oxidase subunit II [Photobacterium sanctipauli]|uniref:Cytochrome d ubiquinol oxidase subunit II n=1 Tax=Photobacterium sanctipauli TaxID=1342794 RepID=A0A2T3NPJ3_9GAMM|nr:cytochrome d ubiquinol oxidase subunit II [Photobacterium sanctipauli]PSW18189.1 cytochrome d ubiquinol oxidase subunit II [Photobacterium sanctipauli]